MSEPKDHVAYHDGYSKGLEFSLSVCLCYTLCVLALRLYIRWRAFGTDDFIVSLSTVLAFVFFGCNYACRAAGLGRPTDTLSSQQDTFEKLNALTLVSNLAWITALCLSKLAIVSMLLHTTVTASHQRLQYSVGALVLTQCIISIILMTAGCTAFEGLAWDVRSNDKACPRQELRWHVITGLDVATELAILVLPFQLVWKLQMSTKNKFIVIAAFWLRVPTLVFTILRDNATKNLGSTADISLTAAMVVVWQAIEMSYSIAAATIAALRRFTESLNTGFGHGELIRVHGHSQGYKMSDRSASLKGSTASKPSTIVEPIPNRMSRQEFRTIPREGGDFQLLKLRPETLQNKVTVSSLPKRSGVKERPDQNVRLEDNSIRHDIRYSVHYDEDPLVSGQHNQ
ncbi:hypothetical protein BU25DRAFT_484485 [Macroventuria anomochaeta]|uniref:Uncharacterized protein n=1 Tax=Macroventuria anomochaeta TaxID=301207 RepID=A0ACB6S8D9_9PLEO|nr:uncharacterized protein BU25DRAFT_484485 [Macroventuria anomochaeta]KAF2630416.1 hypothetical protein BU25DRAFT_484485 [Macroventuria anomochaeta]